MKFKALRYKKEFNDFQEYVWIQEYDGEPMIFTSELPYLHPMTATIEGMKPMFPDLSIDFNKFEFVELEVIETGEVGADIRNKLSPYSNLVALVEVLLNETDHEEKEDLKKFIRKEIIQSKKSVEYIAKLL